MKTIHPAIAEHVMEENEKLRGLLRELREITSEYAWDAGLEARVDAALSQQAEPAPAQDEREAFEVWVKTFNNAPERLLRDECDRYLDDWIQCRWLGWQAALATRPAQTEQQRVGQWSDDEGLSWCDGSPNELASARESGWLTRTLYAAPIAQAAPQPEQSGLVESLTQLLCWAEKQVCTHEDTHRGGAIWEICDSCGAKWADDEGGRPAFVWPKAISNASAALSAQGESHE